MSVLFASPASLPRPADLRRGQTVHVNIRAGWFPATITDLAPRRVRVVYDPLARPRGPLVPDVAPWVVRPAEGVCLKAVHQLCSGDDLLAADDTSFQVAAAWQGRDGRWIVQYTHGPHASLPPQAVLRLLDPVPTVTVHGIPLCGRSPA